MLSFCIFSCISLKLDNSLSLSGIEIAVILVVVSLLSNSSISLWWKFYPFSLSHISLSLLHSCGWLVFGGGGWRRLSGNIPKNSQYSERALCCCCWWWCCFFLGFHSLSTESQYFWLVRCSPNIWLLFHIYIYISWGGFGKAPHIHPQAHHTHNTSHIIHTIYKTHSRDYHLFLLLYPEVVSWLWWLERYV